MLDDIYLILAAETSVISGFDGIEGEEEFYFGEEGESPTDRVLDILKILSGYTQNTENITNTKNIQNTNNAPNTQNIKNKADSRFLSSVFNAVGDSLTSRVLNMQTGLLQNNTGYENAYFNYPTQNAYSELADFFNFAENGCFAQNAYSELAANGYFTDNKNASFMPFTTNYPTENAVFAPTEKIYNAEKATLFGDNAFYEKLLSFTAETDSNFSTETLHNIREHAEKENNFTTAEIRVDMGGITNNLSRDQDVEDFMEIFRQRLEEALYTAAEGVHL